MPNMTEKLTSTILSAIGGKTTLSVPSLYIGLFLTPGNDYYPGREPSDSAYERQTVALSSPQPADDNPGCMIVTNTKDIIFPAASSSWGRLPYYGIFSGGVPVTLLFTGVLDTPLTVNRWDTAVIPAGRLKIRMG